MTGLIFDLLLYVSSSIIVKSLYILIKGENSTILVILKTVDLWNVLSYLGLLVYVNLQ